MMVSGIGGQSMYGQYRSQSAYGNSTVANSQSTDKNAEEVQGVRGDRKGPPPPRGGGKGGPGGGMRGPQVDQNDDQQWDIDELSALSESLSESGATSFDANEVLSTMTSTVMMLLMLMNVFPSVRMMHLI